ncbi:hypothetical protein PLICRDRAFT_57673 [Plicaturopsis crispa FD-325 SS-3]|uniref:Malate dehydrogenase n=1 Tax=Plicaturopsis crispa FD-325 SS-3 TaxID=944288 RepID=A0A0C9SXC6_PLICR|nr:hypothetical protein PLICRDRAFT_57673 [Plicaturopsis crispa FD-325 SS-3]
MSFVALSLLCGVVPAMIAALPHQDRQLSGCDISNAKMTLPASQVALVEPNATTPSFIGLAIGVQNYTCSNTSTYTNVGAVAELFDVSCLYGKSAYTSVQTAAWDAWSAAPADVTAQDVIAFFSGAPEAKNAVLGQHFYVTNPITGTGVSPKWDFTSSGKTAGNPAAFVVGAKAGDIASPAGNTSNVDWLSVKPIQGDLASQIFRIDTTGGQPPASCTPGSAPISVKYTAKYWLFGGSVKK